MKKIVQFKDNLLFKDNLYEITSISLEHSLHKEGNNIEGEFIISGEYRITESSINTSIFNYNVPFSIEMDDHYIIDDVSIDIDDFYYEILDNKYLVVNIDVLLNNIEEKLINVREEDIVEDESKMEEIKIDEPENIIESNDNEIDRGCIDVDDAMDSLFDNIIDKDDLITYKVYILRENDTLETVMEKYKISKEELELYNDLHEIKIGDKLIIPYVKN